MTFKELALKLKTSIMTLPEVVSTLAGAFEEIEGGGSGSGYTTEERDTGEKWIDGTSEIYEKTIVLKENSVDKYTKTANTYINSIPTNAGIILLKNLYAKRGNWIDCLNLKTEMTSCFDLENHGLYFESNLSYTDIIIVIRYTKAT